MRELTDIYLKNINDFWNTEACGTQFVEEFENTKIFFEEYTAFRYRTEWHLPLYIPFENYQNKKVLEIGCGNGADGMMFAKNGALYTGIDITQSAIDATAIHFKTQGLTGTFQVENAESLSFQANKFDLVYSHGVLHHTENPNKAFEEVYRVLKPGGNAILMLYHKNSFNYYIRIMGFMRLRLLLKIFKEKTIPLKNHAELTNTIQGIRGNSNNKIWDIHYQNFLKDGWKYLMSNNFIHHCTDGPECPFAYVYTKDDIKRQLNMFSNIQFQIAHFPLKKYNWGKLFPFKLEQYLSSKIGFYLLIFAQKDNI